MIDKTDHEKVAYLRLVVSDLVSDFMYYDRKECEELPRGEIERLIEVGAVTVDEIVGMFSSAMKRG